MKLVENVLLTDTERLTVAMPERKQVNVKVASEAKERWQEYVDESFEVNSMSDLIRLSVEKEINGQQLDSGNQSPEHLEDISRTLKEIQTEIGNIDSRLERVENTTQQDPEIDRLANEIFPILPDVEPGSRDWKAQRAKYKSSLGDEPFDPYLYYGWRGTVESVAEAFDVSVLDSRKALEKLVSDMARVRTTEYNDKERYWRDV